MAGPGSRTVAGVFGQTGDRDSVLDEYDIDAGSDAPAPTDEREDRFFESTVEEGTAVPASRLAPRPPSVNLQTGELLEQPDVSKASAGRLMEQFVGLADANPDLFVRLQAGMWATGLLSVDKGKFVNIAGTPDERTRQAFSKLMEEVVARRAAGEDVTLEDLIAELDARVTPELFDTLSGSGGAGGVVSLTDPRTLFRMLEQTAEKVGVDPGSITDDVARAFVGTIHAAQRGMRGDTEITQVDPSARVYDFLEERFGAQIERSENVGERQEGRGAFMSSVLGIDRLIGGG